MSTATSDLIAANQYYEDQIIRNLYANDFNAIRIERICEFLTFAEGSGNTLKVVCIDWHEVALTAPLADFSIESINIALQILLEESARVLTRSMRKIFMSKL
ncbi:hypothetical protein FKW77_004792 [Venturia effusa]|uniref:Uncharacterized protein n=1 Tax=Venturia effusa TaxID=50376 RepID=A0A517LIV9_9PEZI|nr:hypothetical protein FKW77_004792 [Venturia effusa]